MVKFETKYFIRKMSTSLILIILNTLFFSLASAQQVLVPDDKGFVSTLNKYGWMSTKPDPISLEFIEFAKNSSKPLLDIGGAYGYMSKLAIENGATVILNDTDQRHLDTALQNLPSDLRKRLIIKKGKFPEELNFLDNSIDAVLARRVFHFLSGKELEVGVRKIYRWLTPGGKVFVFAATPYRQFSQEYIKGYEQKKKTDQYPGEVQDSTKFVSAEEIANTPKFFHFLDIDVLTKLFKDAGFIIETAEYLKIDEVPDHLKLDGRENIGIIAVKPQ